MTRTKRRDFSPHRRDLCGDLNLDVLGLGSLAQRQPDRQQATLALGAGLGGVDCWRQRERPREPTKASLDTMNLVIIW